MKIAIHIHDGVILHIDGAAMSGREAIIIQTVHHRFCVKRLDILAGANRGNLVADETGRARNSVRAQGAKARQEAGHRGRQHERQQQGRSDKQNIAFSEHGKAFPSTLNGHNRKETLAPLNSTNPAVFLRVSIEYLLRLY